MAGLVNRKAYIFQELTAIQKDISSKKDQVELAEAYLQSVTVFESSFRTLVNEIFTYNDECTSSKDHITTNDFSAFEVLINSIRTKCFKAKAVHANKTTKVNVKTPKVDFPKFSGDLGEWSSFIQQYNLAVHTQSLSDVQKFTCLRSVLLKEALAIVDNYEITDSNYKLAYDALVDRYGNPRVQAAYNVRKIVNFKPVGGKHNYTNFLEVHRAATASLKKLGITDLADYLMFELCYQNLAQSQQKFFDRDQKTSAVPELKTLFTYVESLARSEELQDGGSHFSKQTEKSKGPKALGVVKKPKQGQCVFCSGEHKIYHCETFKNEPHAKKLAIVNENNVCIRCLGKHQGDCNTKYSCRKCNSKEHHTTLCKVVAAAADPVQMCYSLTTDKWSSVILATVQGFAKDQWGSNHAVRMVMDPGSQLNLISEGFAKKLGLQRFSSPFNVEGVQKKSCKSQGAVKLKIVSGIDSSFVYECVAIILPTICNDLPAVDINPSIIKRIKNLSLPLADPHFDKQASVDILLSGGVYMDVLSTEQPNVIKLEEGTPGAIRSRLGFLILGHTKQAASSQVSLLVQADPVDQMLQRFWEMEEVDYVKPANPEEVQCEEHFKATHSRCENGQYMVRLPFKKNAQLNSNRNAAYKCFQRLESRLNKNPDLEKSYSEVFEDYVVQNQLSVSNEPSNYLLPHHCVTKDSSTTKVRVVFNASAPDEKGKSLNDCLLPGPALQNDLSDILFAFRLHEVALTADIRQMFRRIWLHPDDRKFQHILWRNKDGKLTEFSIDVVCFGVTSSPYLAQRVLRQLRQDEGSSFRRASYAIENHCFMDDFATGAQSVQLAVQLRQELTSLLSKAGFELRKWACSHAEVLDGISMEHREKLVPFDTGEGVKILGLQWDQSTDSFVYDVTAFDDKRVTKRTILSYIAKIWDCLGLLSAVTVKAKIFLQSLWLEKKDWDDVLNPALCKEWLQFCNEMPMLRSLRIQRKIPILTAESIRLVGFSDASQSAMAANVYLHVTHTDGTHDSFLVKSKTRLAPLKTVTIPRLELCAALLLAKTIQSILTCNDVLFHSVHLFTDSQVVLGWLKIQPHKLKIFVANRVIQILDLTKEAKWGFVEGKNNPADLGSRGINASELLENELWWKGPPMLQSAPHNWYVKCPNIEQECMSSEMKAQPTVLEVIVSEVDPLNFLISKYSSLPKLQRVVAYVWRFVTNIRKKEEERRYGPFSVSELRRSLLTCVKVTQQEFFSDIIEARKIGVTPKHLRTLNPKLNSAGLLMVGGRLRYAGIPLAAKQPLLLPKQSPLAILLCDYYHQIMLHSGPRTTHAAVLQQYWIVSGYQLVKKRIKKCLRCFKLSAKSPQPFMGDLPQARVEMSRPFQSTAIDFAGPIMTKETTRRKSPVHKSYICAFVCLSTKAVHLEVVSELTTAAFMAALYRFTSRRSLPKEFLTDNGKNFVGAARNLREVCNFLEKNQDALFEATANIGVEWKFSPAFGPNFNGLIESVIKSSKSLLLRQIGDDILTFEEMSTLLARIEAVLNSRPLTPLSTDPLEGPNFLTPAHFLVGSDLLSPPEMPEAQLSLKNRWERIQRMSQLFWKKWSNEYLHTLHQRLKWNQPVANIQVGQIVYLKDMNTNPLQWPLGRVVKVHPGRDNVTRVVTVRAAQREYVRPVNKLLVLPFSN